MNEHDLSAGLRTIHRERAVLPGAPSIHQRVRGIQFDDIPHQRGWLPPIFTGRFQSMFSATKFVVAGVIVALFGGFLLAGVLTQQSGDVTPAAVGSASPEATPSTPFKLPAVIPHGIESGTAETPLGTARWVHLSGDYVTPMPLGDFTLTWPTGVAVFDPPDGDGLAGSESNVATIGEPFRLWTSGNGIDWELQPLPVPADAHDASLWLVDDVYWLIANVWSGDRLWRSSDGVTWEEFDPSGLASPGPAGLAWDSEYSTPATAGDLTLILRSGGGVFPFGDLGMHPECRDDMRRLAPGVYRSTNEELGCPTLRFTETETGLQVSDDTTGEVITEIVGADLSLDQMHMMEFRGTPQLLIIGDGEVTPVEVPWPAATYAPGVTLYGVEDGIYAYVANESTVWHTTDGRSWSELHPPSFLDDEPPPEGHPDGTYPLRLESGWFALKGDDKGEELWMYLGDAWVSLSELGMERPDDRCWANNIAATGNTTILRDVRCPAKARQGDEVWILTIDPST
jgi:hypothetical protein